jgi:p-hydroxybenzoate 3-monooxygenase
VRRLCDSLTEVGGEVRFGQEVRAVRYAPGGMVLSVDGPDGDRSEIECEVAVGCEGSKSAVAAAMSPARVCEQSLPVRFLVIRGAAPPLEMHMIYAAHPRGFAGQLRRGPDQTRYMLEIPAPTSSPTGPSSGSARSYQPALVSAGGWTMCHWVSSACWICGSG